ncbi:hypothetical protein GCM10011519_33730 [Marmoricola endophyticus]|uniref:Uncharacterized protein n=1 Tax=Marmoricola endophyticus TaxID=2040280 RepID=A0A917BTP0_9ACTN|nr:hypothetical protein [Marmoricola endophyticus]GGF57025.1 hypothetical protein GCM10011519_33730 [Marmoricola endophyticus]
MIVHGDRHTLSADDVAEVLDREAHTATRDLDGEDLRLTLGYFVHETAHTATKADRRAAGARLALAAERIERDSRFARTVSDALARRVRAESPAPAPAPTARLPRRAEPLPDNVVAVDFARAV